jgi:hypothetical protein
MGRRRIFFNSGKYIGEKCYTLSNEDNSVFITHMKGLNKYFQNQYITNNIDKNFLPSISYNNFFETTDFLIYKTYLTKKNIFILCANKKIFYFFCWKLTN